LSNDKFRIPAVIQSETNDTAIYFKEESLVEVWPSFIGQFKFSDTIYYSGEDEKRYSMSEAQSRWEQRAFAFDTLSSDGLQVIGDYETSIIYADKSIDSIAHYFYPVYIVNETHEPKVFIGKDSYVFAIQEALDTSDYSRWYAIEGRGFDFCGNGYFRRKILPGEFIMFLFPKYSGLEKTLLRARVKIGDGLIVSKPFKGVINRNQFTIKNETWFDRELKKTKGTSANWLFYGGRLKEIDKFQIQ
jgi:hypothetical protein